MSDRHSAKWALSKMMRHPGLVRPTAATSAWADLTPIGIDRRVERCCDNPTGVIKQTATQTHFLAMPSIARIRLI